MAATDASHGENSSRTLHEAALQGSIATLNQLLQNDPLVVYRASLTKLGDTPLHVSALLGHVEFTQALLTHKPQLCSELDHSGRSALHLAAAEGQLSTVKLLLSVDSYLCLVPDHDGMVPLHFAAMRGHVEVIRELIRARPESVALHLKEGTVAHLCIKYGRLEALKVLVEAGLGEEEMLSMTDSQGNTILHLAASMKLPQAIKMLVSKSTIKGMINQVNHIGLTALDVIECCCPKDLKSLEITSILIEAGAEKKRNFIITPSETPKRRFLQKLWVWTKNWIRCHLKRPDNWVDDMQQILAMVATLIATVSFQGAITPPGGVWQQNELNCGGNTICVAGTSVFANEPLYRSYMLYNGLSFVSSLSVLLLCISGLPMKNKLFTWIMTTTMVLAISFLVTAHVYTISLLTPDNNDLTFYVKVIYIYLWTSALLLVLDTLVTIHWLFRCSVRLYRWIQSCWRRRQTRRQLNRSEFGSEITLSTQVKA